MSSAGRVLRRSPPADEVVSELGREHHSQITIIAVVVGREKRDRTVCDEIFSPTVLYEQWRMVTVAASAQDVPTHIAFAKFRWSGHRGRSARSLAMPARSQTTPAVPLGERAALGIREAAEYIGIGRTQIYALISEGRLASRKIGSRRLVLRESCDKLLAEATA
ncbi:helix-turn-helix domain-containing protein [Aquabacter sediminis]|uniref:helix-turn-helix domain-containing protein n=1 Tax=Aquabacter sediminis TaxID=3029197 RepID=UPI00237DF426|nr:helix-turn-helix domain-containing protein [Aquabacter sp. P-9]MDE1567102.1 helix-turn-helix domain-containing protein [Aquabacter sp. P-9]